ncbi:MAG: CAP domain-containing protein [Deltaproteobacteria bacterium]|nr:CAP domain-containing protein [Deltaproteobacteria bacterium]
MHPQPTAAVAITPAGGGADAYNRQLGDGPVPEDLRDLFAAVQQAGRSAGSGAPRWDERLHAVATDLAAVVPEGQVLPYRAVEFALHHRGIIEPTPHLVVVWMERDNIVSLTAHVAERLGRLMQGEGYTRAAIGTARRQGKTAVVVALQSSHIETQPIPRTARTGATVPIRGRVLAPFAQPEVLVARADGTVETIKTRVNKDGSFASSIVCGPPAGEIRLEVSAVAENGASVLANFPIWCGVKPPRELRLAGARRDGVDPEMIESQLIQLINTARRRAGLPELALDRETAAVARRYSEEMARTDQVAHVSSESGAADDRLRRAGVRRGLVQENLARASSAEEAHDGLMNSPGHRANILSAQATHVGVGVAYAKDSGDLLVTELFTRVPPTVDRAAARDSIAETIRRGRALRLDAALVRLAQSNAEELAAGAPRDRVAAEMERALNEMAGKYKRLRTVILALSDTRDFATRNLPQDAATDFGVGVAQGEHRDLGRGAIFVVVLLGQRA